MAKNSPPTAVVLFMKALGEGVFTLPLLHALKHAHPAWRTVCVTYGDVGEIVAASGLADRVVLRGDSGRATDQWRLVRELRRERPAACFALATSAGNTLLAWLSGAPRRIGYDYAHLPRLLEKVSFEGGGVENYLSLLPRLGVPRTVSSYCGLLQVPPAQQEAADALLRRQGVDPAGRFVLVSPISTGKQGVKAYPGEQWAEVCRDLARTGRFPVLVGTAADREAQQAMLAGVEGLSLAGETTPLTLAALAARAACVVGIDTGPIHVAAALGTPCVVLFGSSDPRRTAPCGTGHIVLYRDLDCQPCLAAPCEREGACLREIAPAEIVGAVEQVLAARPAACQAPPGQV
ncbi:MAG TPA: glycosyltransferase family 9 protein [Armatimonadota bacterium]|jgi:ADP-heptose:LPS heptosyltransferase